MAQVWFTADLHLGHANIIKYCLRPFLSPGEEMALRQNPRGAGPISEETVRRHDEALLEAINARVGEADILWILGDFCWGPYDAARHYRERIRCRTVNFIWGNHDHRSIRPLFDKALEQELIKVEDQYIWLNHYPMRSWEESFDGSWSLYGHVHGRLAAEDEANLTMLTKDIGVDACGYRPWSFTDLREYMAPRVAAFEKKKAAFLRGENVILT
jgi:calcineurin-like phosphoesterase family protein